MTKPRKLSWTEDQLKIRALLEQGKSPKQCREAGYKKNTVSRVAQALRVEKKEKGGETGEKAGENKAGISPSGPLAAPSSQTTIQSRSLEPVVVGSFIIEPADWRINQYGGFLILGTYEHARNAFGYTGTVGEFLCDCTQIIRKIMGLDMVATDYLWKEDNNGRRETSEGARVLAQVGENPNGGQESSK
jgi:hypothetical protein